jgi:hypothetical protein
VIYTDDHEPAHIHIVGVGLSKVHLLGPDGQLEVVDVRGIKRSDMRRLYLEVVERREDFMVEWERIHGSTD